MRIESGMAATAKNTRRLKVVKDEPHSFLEKIVDRTLRHGFRKAYRQVELDSEKFLRHVRDRYELPIDNWRDIQYLDESVVQEPASRIIASAARAAALEGAGFGMGGFATILPDMGVLSAITVRMLQKLSLIHGFEYSTEEERMELWLAAATAAGVDLGREFLERQALEKLVPRIIDRISAKAGAEVAEKWAGRIFPMISIGLAGTLNYAFVRTWGHRARGHFLDRHRSIRATMIGERALSALPRAR